MTSVAPLPTNLLQLAASLSPGPGAPLEIRTRMTHGDGSAEYSATAAAPSADVTPGTTSYAIPAFRRASISSPARPKIIGSPDFKPNNLQSGVRERNHQKVDFFLLNPLFAASLSDVMKLSSAGDQTQNRGRNQVVVQHSVGCSAAGADAFTVSNSGSPGPAPTR